MPIKTNIQSQSPANWLNNLKRGDVVQFAAVSSTRSDQFNAFVIIDIYSTESQTLLLMGHGRDIDPASKKALEIPVIEAEKLRMAGLEKPLSFSLNYTRTVSIPHDETGFPAIASPVIGLLAEIDLLRMQFIRKPDRIREDRLHLLDALHYWTHRDTEGSSSVASESF
ncbi:hypothetical protein [uncultured Cohaesibacter sp.]|uniref:hypothetical protein n=1 Tax=uncultured Cohaesibacter sp. TaxID=1002546 RepID=UPI002AA77B2A|nr:hypothetical protein [uncultured Cohaesibacter sp.]